MKEKEDKKEEEGENERRKRKDEEGSGRGGMKKKIVEGGRSRTEGRKGGRKTSRKKL